MTASYTPTMFWRKPPNSQVDNSLGFQAARWLVSVAKKMVFTEEDVIKFVIYCLKHRVVTNQDDNQHDFLEYVQEHCVGLMAAECVGPSPFLMN